MALKNNPEKIGNMAVDKLSDFLQRSEHLDPKIQKHDKNLSWDGGIDYYAQFAFLEGELYRTYTDTGERSSCQPHGIGKGEDNISGRNR